MTRDEENKIVCDMQEVIQREDFCKAFDEAGLGDLFFDFVDGSGLYELDRYLIYNDARYEQITILERASLGEGIPLSISWYKYLHLGRSLCLTNIPDMKTLEFTLRDIKKDIDKKIRKN